MKLRSFLIHTIAATVLLAAGLPAQAGGGHYGHGYGHGYGYGYGHGYGHRYGHGGAHVSYHGHGDVAVGVLAGLLFGYAVLSHRDHYAHDHHAHSYKRARAYKSSTSYRAERVEDVCVKEDRYLTSVIIDGQAVKAWGVACLTPEGIWRRKRS